MRLGARINCRINYRINCLLRITQTQRIQILFADAAERKEEENLRQEVVLHEGQGQKRQRGCPECRRL